jgi:hypothetical protein
MQVVYRRVRLVSTACGIQFNRYRPSHRTSQEPSCIVLELPQAWRTLASVVRSIKFGAAYALRTLCRNHVQRRLGPFGNVRHQPQGSQLESSVPSRLSRQKTRYYARYYARISRRRAPRSARDIPRYCMPSLCSVGWVDAN